MAENRQAETPRVAIMPAVIDDFERCYQFIQSRDSRYDGVFFAAVTSTGVYCRPSCAARLPKRQHVRLFPTAAAAQEAGFRACKRCRPDAAPGSPEWNKRADVAARALRLITDGVVDREGAGGLAERLRFSERHLRRMLVEELGAGPIALARAQRAQTARLLIESSDLTLSEVAFSAGFGSVRQFNDTIRAVFALTPSDLRSRAGRRGHTKAAGMVEVRLARREPFAGDALMAFLRARAIPGVEEVVGRTYRRSLVLDHGRGLVELTPEDRDVRCRLRLDDFRDLAAAVARCRRLLDLDSDPVAVDELLARDAVMRPLVAARPGLRVPGCVDGAELAVRAVLGQQVTLASARTMAARLSERLGAPIDDPAGAITRCFPSAAAVAAASPATLPIPRSRGQALQAVAREIAEGRVALDAGADAAEALPILLGVRGIGTWTTSYIAMRALGDPDAFVPSDSGVARALTKLGHLGDPANAIRLGERWRPWRSYAVLHLWTSLDDASHHGQREPSPSKTIDGERVVLVNLCGHYGHTHGDQAAS
jgi:AraC family transcriptional regulator, regulatory protein of adaptative response / DNA-3-methyladenine glycosylase II